MKKILHISTFDKCGGAAIAAYRLHKALQQTGNYSKMLVQKKSTKDKSVTGLNNVYNKITWKIRTGINKAALRQYPRRQDIFSPQIAGKNIIKKIKKINPDIINLHWICADYISIKQISKLKKPIVWTLHDMWPFTGGCHYSGKCNNYKNSCGNCPALNTNKKSDISHILFKQKSKLWNNLNIKIVAPSRWIAECAESSIIFKNKEIRIIKHCLDSNIFKPKEKTQLRKKFNWPEEKQLILFGAINTKDKRKGFSLLQQALKGLENDLSSEVEVAIFGKSENMPNLGLKTYYLGFIKDENLLSDYYSAADVMVVPSLQESFGQTASESLSCGTPVVSFDTTGFKDIIKHKNNGYLAKPFDTDDLAQGIAYAIKNKKRLSRNARKKALEEFDMKKQAGKYEELYEALLTK